MEGLQTRYRHPNALSKHADACWHTVEAAPAGDVRQMQEHKLVTQMAHLEANSAFYQRKFAEAGVSFGSIRRIEDLQSLPFTYKDEIRHSLAAAPPFGEHCAVERDDIIQMQASSGTTGSPSYVALTEPDAQMWHELTARCLFACGIRPGDLTLHAFGMSKGFVGGIPIMQGLQYMGAVDIPVGADGGVDRLLRAAADLRPRAVVGTPNFVLYLAEQAKELTGLDARELGIERVVVGGEPGGGIPTVRARIEQAWGATCCELLGGTDLAVAYWAECDEQAGMHSVCQDAIITELLDPATGTVIPFEAGAAGELVYTAIGRQASPLVRFRSGDRVEVLGTECGCSRTGPRIRCVGREDDMLIVRGVNVFPSAVQNVVLDMQPRMSGCMRIVADFEGHTTQRNLRVYAEAGTEIGRKDWGALKRDLETRLRETLAFKAEVTIVPPSSFEKPGVKKVALILRETPEVATR